MYTSWEKALHWLPIQAGSLDWPPNQVISGIVLHLLKICGERTHWNSQKKFPGVFFSEDHRHTDFNQHGKSSEISGDGGHLCLLTGSGLGADTILAEFLVVPMFETHKNNNWDSFCICFKKWCVFSSLQFPVNLLLCQSPELLTFLYRYILGSTESPPRDLETRKKRTVLLR